MPPQKKNNAIFSFDKKLSTPPSLSLASAQFCESFHKLIEATIKMTFANGHWNPEDPQNLRLGLMAEVYFFWWAQKISYIFWRRIASFVGIITNPSYQFIRPCIGVVITPVITSGGPSCEGFEHFQFFNFVVVILVGPTVAVKECWDLACNWYRFGWTPWKNEQWISTDDFIKGDHQCTSFSCCGVWTFPSTILKTSMREFLTVTASWPSTPELVSSHDFRNFMELLDMSHPNHPFICPFIQGIHFTHKSRRSVWDRKSVV